MVSFWYLLPLEISYKYIRSFFSPSHGEGDSSVGKAEESS